MPTNSTDDVYIAAGHTITITGTGQISINSLSITGTLTHAANASTDANIVNLLIGAGGLTVDAAGSIDVSSKGLTTVLTSGGDCRPGGVHGGHGGYFNTPTTWGAPYGSITNPVTSGSAGTYGGTGPGGGVVVLNVTGSATINGNVYANGYSFTNSNGGGGAGGSINITADSISGSGTLSAAGGTGYNNTGAGGGGRIAVRTAGSDFGSLQMTAQAGAAVYVGAAGTIYLKKSGDTLGTLLVDGKNVAEDAARRPRTVLPSGTYQFDAIITTNIGVLIVGSNATLNLTGCTLRSNSTTNSITSRLILGTAGSTVTWPAAWTNNGCISWPGTNVFSVTVDLTVASGGILTHESGQTHAINLNLEGDLTVAAGGTVSVAGRGHPAGSLEPGTAGNGRAGGGHGGEGGMGMDSSYRSTTYDSVTNPVKAGSSGLYNNPAAYGGGVAVLRVTGTLTVNGPISADGTTGGAGAAGGTVNITAGSLAGNGIVSANGGSANNNGGGGGGGRIAIVLTNSATFGSVVMSAVGGTLNGENGGAGTIYLKGTNQAYGLLIVSNNKAFATSAATLIGPLVTDAVVGDVRLLGTAKMAVSSNRTLTVHGSWSNAVAANAISGGTVVFAGTDPNPVSVWGGNTWSNLTIATLGKTVNFEAGKTQTVYGLPAFTNVTLQSSASPSFWYLLKPGSGTRDVGRVSVQDSNATNGWTFRAPIGSTDGGHSVNWIFVKPAGTQFLLL